MILDFLVTTCDNVTRMLANWLFSRKLFFQKGIGDALLEKQQKKPLCCSQPPIRFAETVKSAPKLSSGALFTVSKLETGSLPNGSRFFNVLPRKLDVIPTEVPIGGSFTIDWTAQV